MTSMPASRRARAMTLAPRSWPSSPGLATNTRILRPCANSAPLLAPQHVAIEIVPAQLDHSLFVFFAGAPFEGAVADVKRAYQALVAALLGVNLELHIRAAEVAVGNGELDRMVCHAGSPELISIHQRLSAAAVNAAPQIPGGHRTVRMPIVLARQEFDLFWRRQL